MRTGAGGHLRGFVPAPGQPHTERGEPWEGREDVPVCKGHSDSETSSHPPETVSRELHDLLGHALWDNGEIPMAAGEEGGQTQVGTALGHLLVGSG